jgi:hypothetical protein
MFRIGVYDNNVREIWQISWSGDGDTAKILAEKMTFKPVPSSYNSPDEDN